MNPSALATSAIDTALLHRTTLSPAMMRNIALACIANWISLQDDSIAAHKILSTAKLAMELVNQHHLFE